MKRPQLIRPLVNPSDPQSVTRSYFSVRLALGGLGFLLPTVLLLHGIISDNPFPASVSHFYHSSAGDFFVGCLFAIGMFLIAYQDPTPDSEPPPKLGVTWSWLSSTIAGVGAIGVALAPVDPVIAEACRAVSDDGPTDCLPTGLTIYAEVFGKENAYHFGFAILFFVFIMLICLTVLPQSPDRNGQKTTQAKWTYLSCGLVIVIAILGLAFDQGWSVTIGAKTLTAFFLWEILAVFAFAAAWLMRSWEFRPTSS